MLSWSIVLEHCGAASASVAPNATAVAPPERTVSAAGGGTSWRTRPTTRPLAPRVHAAWDKISTITNGLRQLTPADQKRWTTITVPIGRG